jgi:hypothetical protein
MIVWLCVIGYPRAIILVKFHIGVVVALLGLLNKYRPPTTPPPPMNGLCIPRERRVEITVIMNMYNY